MNVKRYGHAALLPRIWQHRIWQHRDDMWPYDVACVAIAESLSAPISTIGAKIEKVPGIRCEVVRLG